MARWTEMGHRKVRRATALILHHQWSLPRSPMLLCGSQQILSLATLWEHPSTDNAFICKPSNGECCQMSRKCWISEFRKSTVPFMISLIRSGLLRIISFSKSTIPITTITPNNGRRIHHIHSLRDYAGRVHQGAGILWVILGCSLPQVSQYLSMT